MINKCYQFRKDKSVKIQYFIYLGGIFHLIWALFDSSWPWLFNWKKALSSLDDFHRVLLPILSQLLVVVYLGFAYISFFHTTELITTGLGNTLLLFVSIYWMIRAAMQIHYMGFNKVNEFNISFSSFVRISAYKLSNKVISYYFFYVFIIGAALYSIPVVFR